MRSQIIRNITWLGTASLAVKPFWIFFLVALTPRLLGPQEYGILSATLALAAMAGSFADLGMSQYTLREVARTPNQATTFFSNFFVLRCLLLTAGICITLLAAWLLGYSTEALAAAVFAGLYWSLENLTYYVRIYFRAFETLRPEALLTVLEKVLVIACGSLLLWYTRQAAWTLAGMAAGMALATIANIQGVTRHLAAFRTNVIRLSFLRRAIYAMLPLGVAGLLTVFYTRVDLVMIEAMLGETPAGQYGQAYRVMQALGLIPFVVAYSALFPRLAATFRQGVHAKFQRLVHLGLTGLGGIGIITALLLTWLAPALIHLLAPDPGFKLAGDTLIILGWTFPFTCLNSLLYIALISMNHHRIPLLTLLIATSLNVGLNFLVIPHYGIQGAAFVTVLSEIWITASYCLYYFFFVSWPSEKPGASSPSP